MAGMSFGGAMEERLRGSKVRQAQDWQKINDEYDINSQNALSNRIAAMKSGAGEGSGQPQGLAAAKGPTFSNLGTMSGDAGMPPPSAPTSLPINEGRPGSGTIGRTLYSTDAAGQTTIPTREGYQTDGAGIPEVKDDGLGTGSPLPMREGGIIERVGNMLGLRKPSEAPQQNANRVADQFGGLSGEAVRTLRARPRQIEEELKKQGLRKGKTRVTDPDGSPTEDTVDAKLADGEAVLNAGAAEMLGRDVIERLNVEGVGLLGLRGGGAKMKDGVLHAATGYNGQWIPGTPATPIVVNEKGTATYAGQHLDDLNRQQQFQGRTPVVQAAPVQAAPQSFGQRWGAAMGDSLAADKAKATAFGNKVYNKVIPAAKGLGKFAVKSAPYAAIGTEVISGIGDTMDAPEGERGDFAQRRAAETAARLGLAYAGGKAGAVTGSAAAPFLGPFAPSAPVIGGLGGAALGYFAPDLGYTTKDEANDRRAKRGVTPVQQSAENVEPQVMNLTGQKSQFEMDNNARYAEGLRRKQAGAADEAGYSQFFNQAGLADTGRQTAQPYNSGEFNQTVPMSLRDGKQAGQWGKLNLEGSTDQIYRRGNEYVGMGAPSRIAAEKAHANDPAVKRAAMMEELRRAGMAGNKLAADMFNALVQEDSYANTARAGVEQARVKAGKGSGSDETYKLMKDAAQNIKFFGKDPDGKQFEDGQKQADFNKFWGNKLAKMQQAAAKEGPEGYAELMRDLSDPTMMMPFLEESKGEFEAADAVNAAAVGGRKFATGMHSAKVIPDLTLRDARGIFKGRDGRHSVSQAIWDNVPFTHKGGIKFSDESGYDMTVPDNIQYDEQGNPVPSGDFTRGLANDQAARIRQLIQQGGVK